MVLCAVQTPNLQSDPSRSAQVILGLLRQLTCAAQCSEPHLFCVLVSVLFTRLVHSWHACTRQVNRTNEYRLETAGQEHLCAAVKILELFCLMHRPKRGPGDQLLPKFNRDQNCWTCPFIMSSVNTRIVRRSAALQQYGKLLVALLHDQML